MTHLTYFCGTMQFSQKLAPLQFVNYRKFIITRFFLIMALRMVTTVVAYRLFHLTNSSFSIGLVGLSEFIPVVTLALYAGHIIDLSDKRTLLLKGFIAYVGCILLLILVTSPWSEARLSIRGIEYCTYGIIFITGIIRAFVGPGTNAIISQLIPREHLPIAANLSSSTFLSAAIIGHASAGFFIAWFGVHYTFYIAGCYVLISIFVFSGVPKLPPAVKDAPGRTWDSVKEGLNYVFQNKILLGAISLDLFAVLFGGVNALMAEVSSVLLKVGPIGFGWLNAAADIGSILSIIYIILNPLKKRQGLLLFFVVAGFGACIVTFGLSRTFWLSFSVLLLSGILDGISVVVRSTILQLTTPDNMRGRVSSVNSMFINSSNELGQFESGFTSRLMGTIPAIIFGGFMTMAVVVFMWFKAPSLRKFEY